MRNSEVALVFYEIADLLELQGVAFKPQAYRRAAAAIEGLEIDIADAVRTGDHKSIPGVGKAIAEKIEELVGTGKLEYLEKLRAEVPSGLIELMTVPDIGPKTAMQLYRDMGISSIKELKKAAQDHRLRALKGFGAKTEERILQGIQVLESKGGRTLLGDALPVADAYVDHLRRTLSLDTVSVCGSLRRGKDTIGDIDILVGTVDPEAATESFLGYPEVEKVLMSGSTKSSVQIRNGLQVDLRVVDLESYGAALQYFTGSKEHNVRVRRIGVEMGLKVNEYGVFERGSDKRVAGASEHEVYGSLGLALIPPELREDSGEIDASRSNGLPDLVTPSDVRGDLHVHSDWSDGADSIESIAAEASRRKYSFVAITDHTESLAIANGLSAERLKEQVDLIREIQEQHDDIRILAGTEVDIKADGSLDIPADVLNDLDIVVASIHSRMKMESGEMTARLTKAIASGAVDVIGHPTGRIIGRREALRYDMQKVLEAASDAEVAMEINAFPDRLDLRDVHCRLAKDFGVKVSIGTDSHSVRHFDYLRLGIITARRGWLAKENVLNSMRADDLVRKLRGRRR